MKHIFQALLFICLLYPSIAWATSTIYFGNDEYTVEVNISDSEPVQSILHVRFFIKDFLAISAQHGEFEEAFCDWDKRVIKIIIPSEDQKQRFEMNAKGDTGQIKYYGKRAHEDAIKLASALDGKLLEES